MKSHGDNQPEEEVLSAKKTGCAVIPKNGTGKRNTMAWIGTSISKQLGKEKDEDDLKVDLKVDRAYCIEDEVDAHFRNKNFKVFLNDKFDTLVLQAGSNEVTNIDANFMDSNKT